jgi:hypothetical protein
MAGRSQGQVNIYSQSSWMRLARSGRRAGPPPCTLLKKVWKVRWTLSKTAKGSSVAMLPQRRGPRPGEWPSPRTTVQCSS